MEERQLFIFARRFFSGTFLSRLSGLMRDVVMAICFGTEPMIAAFFVAYRLANVFRRLFAEGALLSGFIPHYQHLAEKSLEEGARFYRDLLFSMFGFLLIFLVLVEALLFAAKPVIAETFQSITSYVLVMLPSLIFICLVGITSSYLQCKNSFFIPGFSPILVNIVWVAAALLSQKITTVDRALVVCIGVVLGYALQWLIVSIASFKNITKEISLSQFFRPRFFSKEVRQMLYPLFASVIGVGAIQINSGLDGVFSRIATLEGPAYLTYAIRIQQLPIAFFAISIATAFLPMLAKAIHSHTKEEINTLITSSFMKLELIVLFCMFGIFALGYVGLSLLYLHGEFSDISLINTLYCLWAYALALPSTSAVIFYSQIFYAHKNYTLPMKGALFSVAVNIALNSFFIFVLQWGFISVALSTVVAAICNQIYLRFCLRVEGYTVKGGFIGKIYGAGALACMSSLVMGHFLFSDQTLSVLFNNTVIIISSSLSEQIFRFSLSAIVFSLSFYWIAKALKIQEVKQIPFLLGYRKAPDL